MRLIFNLKVIFFFLFQLTNVYAENLNPEDLEYYKNLSKNEELRKNHIKKTCGGDGEFSLEIKDCFMQENDKIRQAVMQQSQMQMQKMQNNNEKVKQMLKLQREKEKLAKEKLAKEKLIKKSLKELEQEFENAKNKKIQQKQAKDTLGDDELEYYYKLNYDEQLKKKHFKKICGQEFITGAQYSVEINNCFAKESLKINRAMKQARSSKDYKSPTEIKNEKLKNLSVNGRLEFQDIVKENIKLTIICDIRELTFHSNQNSQVLHQINFVKNKDKYDVYLDGIQGVIWSGKLGQQKMGDLVYTGSQIKHHPENLFNTKYSIVGLEFSPDQYKFFDAPAIYRNDVNPVTLMFNTSVNEALENKKGDFYLKTYFTGKTYLSKPDVVGRRSKYSDHVLGKCKIKQ